jgi:hypothetical protein
MANDCDLYKDYLFDRAPHFDLDILRDWFPTDDAFIGHMMTGTWDAFTGAEHTFDRVHVAFPDSSGCRTPITRTADTCETCSLPEKLIGWGTTRKTYGLEGESYRTNVLCFDQINSKAAAKEQFSQIIAGLKDATRIIQSNYLRLQALKGAENLYIANAADPDKHVTINAALLGTDCTELHLAAADLPTSQLTLPYLDNFWEPLQLTGYFKSKYVPTGIMKLITDPITTRKLRKDNFEQRFRYSDLQKGSELYKFGISDGVGNWGFAWDPYPMRYERVSGGLLKRIFPWENVPATIGIKPQVSSAYSRARYQISEIWHPEAARVLTQQLQAISPEMPFLVRNLGGKWYFQGGNNSEVIVWTDPATGQTCTVDNKRHNQGAFWADFVNAIRYERPELVRVILHLHEPPCVVDDPTCSDEPASVVQDYSSDNALCPES